MAILNAIKSKLIIILLGLIIIFALRNFYLARSISNEKAQNTTLIAEVSLLKQSNIENIDTIVLLQDQLKNEIAFAEQMQHKLNDTQREIQQKLASEACANMPIPGSDEWVYYSNSNSSQNSKN